MDLCLFRKQLVWFPTWRGTALITLVVGGLVSLWWFGAESFLSKTQREDAEVLIVEGWIDAAGIQNSATEFRLGGYQVIVATGGLSGNPWDGRRWDYSAEAEEQLLRLRLPRDQVIRAPVGDSETQRTFAMARASWRALEARGIHPTAINVYTRGAHARRSRLVFAKVFGSDIKVGTVTWIPPGYDSNPWWHSSERAGDLIKESVGYVFELLFNSGRSSNSPAPAR